jgi:hypothetical protein
MSRYRIIIALGCAVLGLSLLASAGGVATAQDTPGFITTFRRWTRVSSGFLANNAAFTNSNLNPAKLDLSGFHTIYANDKALATYLAGKQTAFAEGSVIVAEFFEATRVGNTTVYLENGAKPKFTAWMIKDATAGADLGGWRWEAWVVNKQGKDERFGGKPLDASTQKAACTTCHKTALGGVAAKTDLVFSTFSDMAHVKDYRAELDKRVGGSIATTVATAAPTSAATLAPTAPR